jgi:hypothetical protein
LGYILGDLFANSFGHPAWRRLRQGCQMVYFQKYTKKLFGSIWQGNAMVVVADIFYCHLAHFTAIGYFLSFGML